MPVFDSDGYFVYNVSRLTNVKGYAVANSTNAYPAFTHTLKSFDTVFICESMIDAFTFFTNGFKAISLNGAGNHGMIKEVFKSHFGKIILALDPDKVGQENTLLIKNILVGKDVEVLNIDFDVNECWTRMIEALGFDGALVQFPLYISKRLGE